MADEPNPQPALIEPLGNAPEVRTPTGEIKDTQTEKQETTLAAKAPETPKAEGKQTAKQGAPEKYADFKPPEGFQIDAKALEVATPIFKELGLSQDDAQRLVDFYAEQSKQAAEAPIKFYEEMRSGWRNELIKDAALGNGTDNLKPEVLGTIGRLLDSLPNAAQFREAMSVTGAGDNPAFVHAFYEIAKRVGEGTAVKVGSPSPLGQKAPNSGPRSAASALYPNLPSAP